jgi:general stress protein YciG
MSAGIAGTFPHTTNDMNPQVNGDEPGSKSASETETAAQEFAPDRPPRPIEAAADSKPKRARGFAAMDRKLVSEIARKGGKAAHSAGTAHEFTSEEARVAGRKGGRATHAKRRKQSEGHDDEAQEKRDD